MTSTITVTNGIGVQAGKVAAYDRVSTFTITGIASAFNGLAVTGLLTTADGATALAPLATGTVTAGAVTLSFDTDTTAMATLMPAGRTADGAGRLTVYATATEADCCVAPVVIMPAAEAGTTTTATDAAAATLAEAQALVDAHNRSAAAHAALFAATVSWPTADGSALADANRFAVGQLSGAVWTWVAKTGTQVLAWIKAYTDTLYAALSHTQAATTVTYVAGGTIAASNVQAAIEELDAEKAPMAAVQHLWLGAGAAISRTTNGAATGTVETGTNDVMYDTFDFDSGTDEGIAWVCTLPHWNLGTIKIKPHWTAASGTGGVCWSFKARAYANDDALDQDGGTPQTSTDTLITAADWHIGPASAAITVAGTLAAGMPLIIQAIRDVDGTTPNLNADARLLGIEIEYTEASTAEAAW